MSAYEFELAINLRTGKALGLTVPGAGPARAKLTISYRSSWAARTTVGTYVRKLQHVRFFHGSGAACGCRRDADVDRTA